MCCTSYLRKIKFYDDYFHEIYIYQRIDFEIYHSYSNFFNNNGNKVKKKTKEI